MTDRVRQCFDGRLLAGKSGSVRYLVAPGIFVAITPRAWSCQVFGRSVTVFDGRNPYLPFNPDKPDAPGFWVNLSDVLYRWLGTAYFRLSPRLLSRVDALGDYYVAFNRGKDD